jgi:hypothetical protein
MIIYIFINPMYQPTVRCETDNACVYVVFERSFLLVKEQGVPGHVAHNNFLNPFTTNLTVVKTPQSSCACV